MTRGEEFRSAVRGGTRAAQPALVAHAVLGTTGSTRVGFVVSKAVGTAVDRNRVKRRLRHLMRDRIHTLPPGSRVVVRALPASASASSTNLGEQLDAALAKSGAAPSGVR